jgi:Integrase
MTKVGGRRNYGYGKTLAWAGKSAIRDRYGEGHFATRAAHAARWTQFAAFANRRRVKDARQVTAELLNDYGEQLARQVRARQMAVRYAQNLLSTVNVVLETMRGDRALRVLPSAVAGRRDDVRRQPPRGLDRDRVGRVIDALNRKGERRVALVAALARDLGLRFREASLLDTRRALREALRDRRVNITEGTKGGRGKWVDRWVPVTPEALGALQRAAILQGNARNLIPSGQTFKVWRNHAYGIWRLRAKGHGLIGFHDLRAAYACERYEALTGKPAPVVAGCVLTARDKDRAARQVIARELGHGRIDVLVAYIGKAG